MIAPSVSTFQEFATVFPAQILASVAWNFPVAMLLRRSFIPNETAFVAFLFRHAVHFTYYQVDLLICFSGWMLLFMRLYCPQLWQILFVAVMHLPVGTSGSG